MSTPSIPIKRWLLLVIVSLVMIIGGYFFVQNRTAHDYNEKLKYILNRITLVDTGNSHAIMDGNHDDSAYIHVTRQVLFAASFKNADAKLYTLLRNADIFSYYIGVNIDQRRDSAKSYYLRVLQEAKETKRPIYECKAYVGLAGLGSGLGNGYPFMKYAACADSVATSIQSDSLQAIAYIVMGNCFMVKNKRDTAYRYFNMASNLANKLGDSTIKRNCYLGYANLYLSYGWYDDAAINASKAMQIDSSVHNHNTFQMVQDYVLIAQIHSQIPQIGPQMARECYYEMLNFCKNPQNRVYHTWIDNTKLEIYKTYIQEKHFDRALAFLNDKANHDAIFSILSHFHQTYTIIWNKARRELQDHKFAPAKKLMDEVIDDLIFVRADDKVKIQAYIERDSILIALGKEDEAAKNINDTVRKMAKTYNLNCNLSQLYQFLSKSYKSKAYGDMANYEKALKYQELSSNYKDSIAALLNDKQFSISKLLIEKKHSDDMLTQTKEKKQNSNRILYLVGFIVASFIMGLVAWFKILRQRAPIIKFLIVLSFLLTFELISHFTGDFVTEVTHDNTIIIFLINLIIGVILGAFHSFLEGWAMKKLNDPAVAP